MCELAHSEEVVRAVSSSGACVLQIKKTPWEQEDAVHDRGTEGEEPPFMEAALVSQDSRIQTGLLWLSGGKLT